MSIRLNRDRNDPVLCGIYCIKHRINGKIYVGSSLKIHTRVSLHRAALIANRHSNIYLQRSFNKHGESKFKVTVLELTDFEKLVEREQYWIDKLQAVLKGFNIEPIAGRSAVSEVTRKKISTFAKLRWKTDSAQRQRFFDLVARNKSPEGRKRISDRRIGQMWSDDLKAKQSIQHKQNKKLLGLCRRNARAKRGIKRPAHEVEKIRMNAFNRKPVTQLSINGELIANYTSIGHVKRKHGFAPSHVIDCCKGRIKTAYGFIWKYAVK